MLRQRENREREREKRESPAAVCFCFVFLCSSSVDLKMKLFSFFFSYSGFFFCLSLQNNRFFHLAASGPAARETPLLVSLTLLVLSLQRSNFSKFRGKCSTFYFLLFVLVSLNSLALFFFSVLSLCLSSPVSLSLRLSLLISPALSFRNPAASVPQLSTRPNKKRQ